MVKKIAKSTDKCLLFDAPLYIIVLSLFAAVIGDIYENYRKQKDH